MPAPSMAGVLGMARMTAMSQPAACFDGAGLDRGGEGDEQLAGRERGRDLA